MYGDGDWWNTRNRLPLQSWPDLRIIHGQRFQSGYHPSPNRPKSEWCALFVDAVGRRDGGAVYPLDVVERREPMIRVVLLHTKLNRSVGTVDLSRG